MGFRDLVRQLRLLPVFLRLSVLSIAENKIQIWGAIFSTAVNLSAYIAFWNVITDQVPILTGAGVMMWGRGELTFLMGLTEFAWGLGAFLWMGIWEIHWYITEMGLEEYLIRPAGVVYQIIAKNFWFGGVAEMAVGGLMCWLAVVTFGLPVSLLGLPVGVLALIMGQAALYILWAGLACLAFWIGRNEALLEVADAAEIKFARTPIDIMPSPVQYFLTFILPVIYISTVPTMLMLGQLPVETGLLYLAVASLLLLFWGMIFRFLLRRGLKRYQPVGG